MKKKLLFVAVTVLALASCSSDETMAVKQDSPISFRALTDGVTRSVMNSNLGITSTNLTEFKVTAYPAGTNTAAFIDNETFTKDASGYFKSTNKYYWPSTGNLDFYASAPISNVQAVMETSPSKNPLKFTVTPAVSSDQVDLVYAAVKNKGKNDGVSGLPLNFRHAGSKVSLKVNYSGANSMLKFYVKAWAIGYLDKSGVFTFPDYATNNTANTTGSGTLPIAYWTNNTDWATDKQEYVSSDLASAYEISSTQTTYTFDEPMILVPQGTIPAATKYSATSSGAAPEGSYVAVKMAIKDAGSGSVVQAETWAMWPVSINWEPGKHYTYNVAIDNGGYFKVNSADGDDDLDPILEGSEIFFATVTVDSWDTTPGETAVTKPTQNLVYGTNYTFNEAATAQTMTFNLHGLTGASGNYIKVSKSGSDASQIISTTPALDTNSSNEVTTATVTAALAANNDTSNGKTCTLTIQEYDSGNSTVGTATVITINQDAAPAAP